MIIAYTAGGRTGNQLYHFLYLCAASLEFGFPFRLIAFRAHKEFEFATDAKRICSYRPLLIRLIRKMRRIVTCKLLRPLFSKLGWSYVIAHDSPVSLTPRLARSGGELLFFDCWPYIDTALLKKHQARVRELVRPRSEARERASAFLAQLGVDEGVPVVGVHIRRTDYREWLGGKHFYELSTYRNCMKRVSELMGGQVAFVICSDERLCATAFADVPCLALKVSQEAFMTDFALLMQCDYTMGPPSTFRMTSAFLGNTPSFCIATASDEIPTMARFQVPLIDAQF